MLTIFANKYTEAVGVLFDKLKAILEPSILIGTNAALQNKTLLSSEKALIYVGETSQMKHLIAESFEIPMLCDNFAESSISRMCEQTKKPIPPRHLLDKLCAVPEAFNNFPILADFQSGCFGEYNKKLIFVVPDNVVDADTICDTYIYSALSKIFLKNKTAVYKIFALNRTTVLAKLSKLENSKYVSQSCETQTECDFRVVAKFKNAASQSFIANYSESIKKLFDGFLYAESETSLQQEVVSALLTLKKRAAVAESITGGLISGKIVDISGASKVLYEGIVAYTIEAKSSRLGINPLFIDKYGVVSSEVATAMAESLLKDNSADFSISTTGFADSASTTVPAGLCFIGIGTQRSVKVYRFEFSGNRRQIRNQAANSALFLLLATIKNTTIETIN